VDPEHGAAQKKVKLPCGIPVVASIRELKRLGMVELPRQFRSREAMRVRRLDHVLLAMPAGKESDARKFYRDILGIPEAKKPPELAARGGCWFEDGELKVHLGVEKNFAPARKAHPAFIVDDLAGLTAVLTDAGYAIAHDKPLAGYDRIFVDDPFGNRIELMEIKPS
jgi:catechol 2,3-dioxygenase-like lactoylglutathione lyase family enzyme